MFGLGRMATSIPLFVSRKTGPIDALRHVGFLATGGHSALISVIWMESVIHIAAEIARAMKPRAGAYEDISSKPFWAVVSGGSAAIRRRVIVAVGTLRSDANIHGDLSLYLGD
jgi:hypothetical protein